MGRSVDIEKWSELLGVPYTERYWHNYRIGPNGGRLFGKGSYHYSSSSVSNACDNPMELDEVLECVLNNDWESCVDFYIGLLVFGLKEKHDFIDFYEQTRYEKHEYLPTYMEKCRIPDKYRATIEKIWKSNYSFKEYLRAASKLKNTFFNLESAFEVYDLQGDDAILSILAQAFWRGSRKMEYNIVLTPELPITRDFTPSKFVSGVVFPCVVSKFPKKIESEFINDGWFLKDENGLVLDCVGVGQYNLWREPLSTRLGYLGRGGISTGLICWCWGDITKAVGQYGGDVLVRSLNEPLLQAQWHKFGPSGKIAVITKGKNIYSEKKPKKMITNKTVKDTGRKTYKHEVMMLNGRILEECTKDDIVFSKGEMEDWFELYELCKKELRK